MPIVGLIDDEMRLFFFLFLSFYLDGRRHGATEGERENEGLLCYLARSRWKKRKRSKSFSILFENEEHSTKERTSERNVFFFVSR